MKTTAFVPIKLNNQRTPGKNLKKFDDGTPLITLFLKTLVKVKSFDDIYVFCSSPEIKDYLVAGVKFLQRPEYLDSQKATPQQIIQEFMRKVDSDIYAVCHCTSPFVTVEHFEECVQAAKSEEYDSAFTAEKLQHLFWTDENRPMNFDPADIPRTQDIKPIYSEVSAAYVFKREVFEKYQRRIGMKPYIAKVSGIENPSTGFKTTIRKEWFEDENFNFNEWVQHFYQAAE